MPLAIALVAQAFAGLVVIGAAVVLLRTTAWQNPLILLLAIHGCIAALLGRRMGLANWWMPIQFAFPFAVAAALKWPLPNWIFPVAFVGLVLVFWNSARGGVPLYLTNSKTKAALAEQLPSLANFRFADIGCGLGGPVLALSENRPDGNFTGIESAPLLFLASWLRKFFQGSANTEIVFSDFWSVSLSKFDVVYCFLSPVPMPALFEKARLEMKPGSLLISNSFEVPEHPADEIVEVQDTRQTKLHVWRM
ncbi:MAG: class I SAM-dependent methyltransferase [Alphaproteobacteria bacterium]|jgi:hypothetical protein|nr:class I SAM-dependent methyltransferase [Alphaproteobacteria bacterium]